MHSECFKVCYYLNENTLPRGYYQPKNLLILPVFVHCSCLCPDFMPFLLAKLIFFNILICDLLDIDIDIEDLFYVEYTYNK